MFGSLAKSCMALSSPVQVPQAGVFLWNYQGTSRLKRHSIGRLWRTTVNLPEVFSRARLTCRACIADMASIMYCDKHDKHDMPVYRMKMTRPSDLMKIE
jgi:hypothetical protein